MVDDEEHVTQLKLPSNVIHTPEGRSLADMMATASWPRVSTATPGWAAPVRRPPAGRKSRRDYPDLFPNAAELEAEWYGRTGIYPMHGTIVVKDSVLAEHPWVAKSLFDAFSQAKDEWLARLDAGEPDNASDKKYAELRKIVGHDPLPYGIEANIATIKALEETAFKQGLTPRRMSLDELFVDPENDLA